MKRDFASAEQACAIRMEAANALRSCEYELVVGVVGKPKADDLKLAQILALKLSSLLKITVIAQSVTGFQNGSTFLSCPTLDST
jgi:hypothetical protein